jgi:hypothetical protein
MGVSLGFEFADDVFELPGHELVVDDDGQSASLLVVADGAGDESLVLLLDADVIVDQHLHVKPIVALLLETLDQAFILAFFQFGLDISLNFFDKHPGLADLFQCLLVLLHLAEDGCFIEVCGHDIVFLLIFEVFDECFFEVDGVADCLQCHHEVFVLLQDAGQVIEGEYLQFGEGRRITEMFGDLWEHDDVDCFGDELYIATLLLVLDVLHGQLVHLLDELPYLLSHAELYLQWLLLQQH